MACGVPRQFAKGHEGRALYHAIANNPVFTHHHMGFALYDPAAYDWLCQYHADQYFTPASNMKLLTLLSCLHVLEDSIVTYRYLVQADTMFFSGAGDPSFLYDLIPSSSYPFAFLKAFPGRVVYLAGEAIDPYGPGWAWDDYRYAFQVERSLFPVYGNRITVTVDGHRTLKISPPYFGSYFLENDQQGEKLERDPFANAFSVNTNLILPDDTLEIPFIVSDFELTRMLADTLGRPVQLSYATFDQHAPVTRVFGASRDSLLKEMMQLSDNFTAEQLLMQCAYEMRGTFQSDTAIAIAERMLVQGSPDPFVWVDGSGLSRYNLATPRSLVWLLAQIQTMTSQDYIEDIFAAGGVSGTLAGWYGADAPFVYAKTGTLSHQLNLSGFLRTDSGRWLIFSFMHNNLRDTPDIVRKEIDRVLREIKADF